MKLTTKLATFSLLTVTGLVFLAPLPAPAANKDMEELQRDVATLQDQIKTVDSKMTSIQTMLQQALDTANRTNSNVSTLSTSVAQTMQTQLKDVREQLNGVTGLSVKVDNISNDLGALSGRVEGLATTVNRQQQLLSDINNQLKLLQAPAAAPPPVNTGSGAPAGAGPPPPTGQSLFENAVRDSNAGHVELAISGFQEFLKVYPNDPNASKAQFNIGNTYYSSGKLEEAEKAFDAVIEQYPDDVPDKPNAYYMKGMAYEKDKKKAEAIATFEALRKKFPGASEAELAQKELTKLGVAARIAPKKPR